MEIDLCRMAPPPEDVVSFDVGIATLSVCHVVRCDAVPWCTYCPPFRMQCWSVIRLGGPKTQLKDAVAQLVLELAARPELLMASRIRIEQQPMMGSRKAFTCVRNQTISHALYTYYAALGHKDVGYVHPVHKLKMVPPIACVGRGGSNTIGGVEVTPKGKANYSARKSLAVRHAAEILRKSGLPEEAWFARQKKKDDLADSMLQGLYCLFRED